jgi:hypothetical protein
MITDADFKPAPGEKKFLCQSWNGMYQFSFSPSELRNLALQ